MVLSFFEFIQLKNQINDRPVRIEAIAFSAKKGKKTSKYPTRATAMAAFVDHIETQ